MAKSAPSDPQRKRDSVKGPLVFSAILAVVAGFFTMIFSTGGAEKPLRWDLGLTAAGIAFIASLVVCALMLMTEKPNAEHLGKGSGVNLSAAKIPGGAGAAGSVRKPEQAPVPQPGQQDAHQPDPHGTRTDGTEPGGARAPRSEDGGQAGR